MKPIILTMSAFGPYAGDQKVDFRELKDINFFLIHGPTGSGKTTILDAMCYALYGDTSGLLRSAKAMRSNYADIGEFTRVSFDFAIGQQNFRVQRSPEQERPKRSGTGTMVETEQATLWDIDTDLQELSVLATGTRKVTEKIEELLGFKSDQFRQVVLLPQGEFRRLLLATSEERQKIMQTLFKTEYFQYIERKLKEKAQELKRQAEDLRLQQKIVLQEAQVSSAQQLASRMEEQVSLIFGMTTDVNNAKQAMDTAQRQLSDAENVKAKFVELEQAISALQELKNKIAVVDEKRIELEAARKAAGLADAENAVLQYKHEAESWCRRKDLADKELHSAQVMLQTATEILTKEKTRENERLEAARHCLFLEGLFNKCDLLQQAYHSLEHARQNMLSNKEFYDKYTVNQAELNNKSEEYTQEYQQILHQASQVTYFQSKWENAQRILTKRKELTAVQERIRIITNDILAKERLHKQKIERVEQTKARLRELQKLWISAQAALLSANLEAGQPCPVCGSLHHPKLAVIGQDIPTEKDIDVAQSRLEIFEREMNSAQDQLNDSRQERNIFVSQEQSLQQDLGQAAEQDLASCERQAFEWQQEYTMAVEMQNRIELLKTTIAEVNAKREALLKQFVGVESNYRAADQAYVAAQTIVREREKAVPVEYRKQNELQHAYDSARRQMEFLKNCLNKAQNDFEEANQKVTIAQTNYDNVRQNADLAMERLRQETAKFINRLRQDGFTNEQEFQAAKKNPDYLDKLTLAITNFDKRIVEAQGRYVRAEQEAQGLVMPDVNALKTVLVNSQEKYAEVRSDLNARLELHSREEVWLQKINKLTVLISDIEEEYGVVGLLAQVADGRGINRYGVTLQRFVLGALLDDVAAAANVRLKTMSRGRYLLRRTLDRARRNAAAGLELDVFDNYTGAARSVNTLSGGETFLASLSLALGLADVVQSYAGGIHLDTIFVDEGFGSLDPETLDFAVRALIDLQRGGRLVGIISHVPELKERIDARLEIRMTDRGSQARFVV